MRCISEFGGQLGWGCEFCLKSDRDQETTVSTLKREGGGHKTRAQDPREKMQTQAVASDSEDPGIGGVLEGPSQGITLTLWFLILWLGRRGSPQHDCIKLY